MKHEGPTEKPDAQYPFVLTTGRHLDAYNTGVQTSSIASPLRRGETLDLSPEDAGRLGITPGDQVRVTSRRGSVVVRTPQQLRQAPQGEQYRAHLDISFSALRPLVKLRL